LVSWRDEDKKEDCCEADPYDQNGCGKAAARSRRLESRSTGKNGGIGRP